MNHGGRSIVGAIRSEMLAHPALLRPAQRETMQALEALRSLPDTSYLRALAGLARFAQ